MAERQRTVWSLRTRPQARRPEKQPERKYVRSTMMYAKDRQAENRRLADYYIHDFYQVLDGTYETLAQEQE